MVMMIAPKKKHGYADLRIGRRQVEGPHALADLSQREKERRRPLPRSAITSRNEQDGKSNARLPLAPVTKIT